jgi:PAS domain S-box-containing protein
MRPTRGGGPHDVLGRVPLAFGMHAGAAMPDDSTRERHPGPHTAGVTERDGAERDGAERDGGREAPNGEAPNRETREREAALRRAEERRAHPVSPRPERRASPPGLERRALRVAERAFPALAENVRDYAIFLMDPHGVITYWGEGARHIKWWMKDEAEGAHLRLLYLDGGSEDGTAEAHLVQAARDGEYVGEGRRVRRDGSTFWAGVTLTALRDGRGQLLGFSKVTRDLTARRAADAALGQAAEAERARAAAEAVSEARGRFVATMSHEVRTPINAVLGYAKLLETDVGGTLSDEQRRFVARLQVSARHLLGLVEDVLERARLDADRAPVAGQAHVLGDAVAAALTLVEPQAHEGGIELRDDTASTAARLSYWGREDRVRQILVNLLANALKYARPRDGAPARVTVSAGAATQPPAGVTLAGDGPWVFVRVEDTGPGVPAAKRAAIFEPFVQLDRRDDHATGGAGLGLPISRRFARQMGGDISLDGATGEGAAFALWLPMAPLDSLRTGGV